MNVQSSDEIMVTATQDKRNAILSATLDLVAERGFHDTPMSQIAKRSKVSAGIIYHYFDNKDALIHELYREIKSRYSSALLQSNPQDNPFPDDMEQLWLNAFDFHISNPKETKFLEQYENSPFHKNWDEDSMLMSEDENLATLMQMIQSNFEAGYIRQLPYVVLYELTMGVAVGLAKRQINGDVQLDENMLKSIAVACRRAIEA